MNFKELEERKLKGVKKPLAPTQTKGRHWEVRDRLTVTLLRKVAIYPRSVKTRGGGKKE